MFWLAVPEFQFIVAEGVCGGRGPPMAEARSIQRMPAVVSEVSLSVLPDTFRYSDGDSHGYHGTKEMAQVVKCLLYKHKDQSLIP